MAIVLPTAFQPIGASGTAQIAPTKILGSDEWTDIVANDAYLRSALCRRRSIGYANQDDPLRLESASGSVARYFELYRGRFELSDGRDDSFVDYDMSDTVLRVRHLHVSQFQTITSIIGGGSGYTVGDTLAVVGGTGTAATLTVDAISGGGGTGPVSALSLTTPGSYTAFPRSAVVGRGPETIVSGGQNYTAGDILTAVGGTGTAAVLQVGTVTSGSITSFSTHSGGDYSLSPFDVVLTTGGTGTLAKLRLDFGDGGLRHCTVTGGTGTGAIFNLSRGIMPLQSVTAGARAQGTFTFLSIPDTEYDVLIEARNTTTPTGTAKFYALRYMERAILVGAL